MPGTAAGTQALSTRSVFSATSAASVRLRRDGCRFVLGGLPWRLTFSYGRALQAAPQNEWSGKAENVAAAQRAFSHRARMNGLASLGQWKADLEKKAA